jgi:hypothetical protein
MKAPAQAKKSSANWWLAEGRNNTTKSEAVMKTHFMIVVTIANPVCPPSVPFAGEARGGLGRPLTERHGLEGLGCYGSGDLVEG